MEKTEFLKKHNLTEADYRNLQRFEEVRKSGIYNMYEYYLFDSLEEAKEIKNRYISQEEKKGLIDYIHFIVSVDYIEEE